MKRSSCCAAISLITAGFVQAAKQGEKSDTATVIEEVVVTAQKRAESVQSVPIAINAYTGLTLENSGVENTIDLQFIEPSLVFTTNAVFGQPYLRGVGTDLFTPGAESSIATFVDDVYQSRTVSAIQDFVDVQRVEVVKGPQGVLFGRNAVGGAINVYTNRPENEFGGKLSATFGNYDKMKFEGVLNTPLVEDKVLFRVAALYSDRDGYTTNVADGQQLDDEGLLSIRSQLLIRATDKVDILISGSYTEEDSSRNMVTRVDTTAGAAIADAFGAIRPDDTFETALNEDPNVDLETHGLSATVDWDLDWGFVKSITSYRETDLSLVLDLDASQLDFASNTPVQLSDTFTQEFQVGSSSGDAFEWIAGFYYLSEDASQQLNVSLDFPAVTGAPSGILDSSGGQVKTESFGLFFNGRYQLTEKLAASAGIRYNYDDRELDFLETVSLLADGTVVAEIPLQLQESFDAYTPRFILEYQASDDVLFYGSISRGYKAGGFNTNTFQTEGFDPEILWAYETGLKSTLWDGRSRVNSALYYYDYSNLQLNTIPPGSPVGTFQIVINAAEATIKGWEADVVLVPVDPLEFTFGISILDAEFSQFSALNPNDAAAGEVDRSGGRLPRAPELSFNIGAQYSWDLDNGQLILRGDLRHEDEQFLDIFQDESVQRDQNTIINSRLTYESGDNWKASLWVRNLTDEEVVQSSLRVDGLFGTIQFFALPRTFGTTVEYSF